MKRFKVGFTVGRFQFVHKGHEQLIDIGLDLCEKFIVLIGSANESRTSSNPFTFEERKEMLQKIYGDKIIILPLVDLGIGYVPAWGNYILNTIKLYTNEQPDFVITGQEVGRDKWLGEHVRERISQLTVSRDVIIISATKIRELLKTDTDVDIYKYLKNRNYLQYISDKYTPEDIKNYSKILKSIKD